MNYKSIVKGIIAGMLCLGMANMVQAQKNKGPVTFTMKVPGKLKAGEQFVAAIIFDAAEGWHIYAPGGSNEAMGMIETKVEFDALKGFDKVGELTLPAPQFSGPYMVYKGAGITFSQAFKVSPKLKPGSYTVKGRIRYQTCNESICYPPRVENFVTKIIIK